jgi:Tfp pilus assembly protein PilF
MSENPRIEALRRRLEKDPASIAFAQLAEEYRRGGDYHQAITICREGLARHPGYLSAQVTLGRALIELGQFDDARKELQAVLSVAPDNLAAIRALADIHQQVGETEIPHLGEPESAPPPLVSSPLYEPDPALPVLEQWLAAIVAARAHSR